MRLSMLAIVAMVVVACSPTPYNAGNVVLGKIIPEAILPTPRPYVLDEVPKDAPDVYKKGYKDGCESGLAAYGNTYYKKFYSFVNDPNLVDDPIYYRVWTDSFNYCRNFINRYQNDGFFEGEGFNRSGVDELFSERTLRDVRDIDQGERVIPGFMEPINTPGWGDHTFPNFYDGGTRHGDETTFLFGGTRAWTFGGSATGAGNFLYGNNGNSLDNFLGQGSNERDGALIGGLGF